MATVYYSTDGGLTWKSDFTGDAWPTDVGVSLVRLAFPVSVSRRVRVRIDSEDADTYQIRSLVLKGNPYLQEMPLGVDYEAVDQGVQPRRFSQETEPTIEAGELAIWYKPSTGQDFLIYSDADAGVVIVEAT